ncbi:ABC transporter permease [Candidatus Bipolaricaulota bacterium]|nr:ABC transporter permease [Candidatus Bipolaricaulota bacterium]
MLMLLSIFKKYKMQCGLIVIASLIMILFMATSPKTFLRPQIYLAFLSTVPFIGIMAVGITVVLVSAEIDLSFPAVMGFAGFAFATGYEFTGSLLVGVVMACAAGAIVGTINGLMVTKIGIPSIIITLGMQFLIRGAVNILASGMAKSMRGIVESPVFHALVGKVGGVIPAQSLWWLAITVIVWFMLFRHKFGDHVLFVGDNQETARMMGINVVRTKTLVFIAMGILAAFAGVLNTCRLQTWWPTMGDGYLMMVMAAAFVGGTSMFGGEGTILGTFIGAFLIGSLEAGIVAAGLSGFWTRFVYGLLILIAVTVHAYLRKRE